jgi:hypothetical protein
VRGTGTSPPPQLRLNLPQALVCKSPTRTGLEVVFEFPGLALICKCVIADQFPWFVFCGVSRAAGVMGLQPGLEVGRKADITLVGFLFALREIT